MGEVKESIFDAVSKGMSIGGNMDNKWYNNWILKVYVLYL